MAMRALVILANGFEEIEAVAPIDILRRAGIEVIAAGLVHTDVVGAHGIKITADLTLDSFEGGIDAIILPGGSEGAQSLAQSTRVEALLNNVYSQGGLIAAICAAPAVVLGPMGLLGGKKVACYPDLKDRLPGETEYVNEPVVTDAGLVTASGAGAAIAFAVAVVEKLLGKERASRLALEIGLP